MSKVSLNFFQIDMYEKHSRLRHTGQKCTILYVLHPMWRQHPSPSSSSFDEKIAFFCFPLVCKTAVLTGLVSSESLINSAGTFLCTSYFKTLHCQHSVSKRWDQWCQFTTLFITINVSWALHPQLFSSFGWQNCQMYSRQSLQSDDSWWRVEHSRFSRKITVF